MIYTSFDIGVTHAQFSNQGAGMPVLLWVTVTHGSCWARPTFEKKIHNGCDFGSVVGGGLLFGLGRSCRAIIIIIAFPAIDVGEEEDDDAVDDELIFLPLSSAT